MASIDRETVLHVAKLAKLELSGEEIELFRRQLAQILEYFNKLQRLDTRGVEPLRYLLEAENVLRPDEPRPSIPAEEALRNAPKRREGFFEVPLVIEMTP